MSSLTLNALFGQPPQGAIDYLQNKQLMPSLDWTEVLGKQHDRAFVVAQMVQLDLLEDVRKSLVGALEKGWTLEQWQAQIMPTMQAKGWWGKQIRVDGDGNAREVQLGSPTRLRTIYETNIANAYERGRNPPPTADELERRPYVMYSAILDSRTRPHHAALHGRVFRRDDPMWSAIAPKNGYRCRCTAINLSARQAGEYAITDDLAPYTSTELVEVGQRSGQTRLVERTVVQLPNEPVFRTDAGWNGSPAKIIYPDLNQYPVAASRQFVKNTLNHEVFSREYSRIDALVSREIGRLEGQGVNWQSNQQKADMRKRLTPTAVQGTKFPVAVVSEGFAKAVGSSSRTVLLSDDTLLKQIINRQGQDIGVQEYGLVQPTIEAAALVSVDKPYHYTFYRQAGKVYVAVIKVTQDGREIYLQSFRYGSEEKMQSLLLSGRLLTWEE